MKEMTMTFYIAEDGTRFDSYDDCYNYEMSQKDLPFYDGGVVFFDGAMENPTIITKESNIDEFLTKFEESAYYIRFSNKSAVKPFLEFLDDNCLTCQLYPREEEKDFIPGDIYEPGDEDEYWHNYSKKLRKQVEAEKKMREWNEPTIEERG